MELVRLRRPVGLRGWSRAGYALIPPWSQLLSLWGFVSGTLVDYANMYQVRDAAVWPISRAARKQTPRERVAMDMRQIREPRAKGTRKGGVGL